MPVRPSSPARTTQTLKLLAMARTRNAADANKAIGPAFWRYRTQPRAATDAVTSAVIVSSARSRPGATTRTARPGSITLAAMPIARTVAVAAMAAST
jgi:hypothetical protein